MSVPPSSHLRFLLPTLRLVHLLQSTFHIVNLLFHTLDLGAKNFQSGLDSFRQRQEGSCWKARKDVGGLERRNRLRYSHGLSVSWRRLLLCKRGTFHQRYLRSTLFPLKSNNPCYVYLQVSCHQNAGAVGSKGASSRSVFMFCLLSLKCIASEGVRWRF